MENKDPDTLIKDFDGGRLGGNLLLSLIVHVLLIALTSFGLYSAWAKWGVHAPNEIKRLEKAAAKEAAKQAAAEAAAQKTAEAAKTEADKPVEEGKAKPEAAPAKAGAEPAAAKPAEDGKLPLDKQVSKPPKSFDLNDIDL